METDIVIRKIVGKHESLFMVKTGYAAMNIVEEIKVYVAY